MQLILVGKITPKARPRVSKGHAYLPQRYRLWKESAIAELQSQWRLEPLSKAKIEIIFGAKGQRGDLDNLAGSVLDALVQGGVILDDRLSCCPQLNIKYCPNKAGENLIILEAIA